MLEGENQNPNPEDAPGDGEPGEGTSQSNQPAEPKIEVIDGKVTVDGKKFVPESDLIAAKESLKGEATKAQGAHEAAVNQLSLQVSEANQKLASANAALEEAQKARDAGATSDEEVARIKQEAETANTNANTAVTQAVDYRRKYIMAVYNIPADSDAGKKLMEKNMTELDSFEEALKAVAVNSGGGPGNYAIGAGGGGAAPVSDMDRAKSILENTPQRGVRNTPTNNQ